MRKESTVIALRTALIYLIAAGVWILFSDRLLVVLVTDPEAVEWWSVAKGWAFVGVTALLLFLELRRQLRRWEKEAANRAQAEAEMRASQKRFATVFHASPIGIVITRLDDSHIIDVNEAFADMHGYHREEMIGRAVLELNLWADPAQREEMIRLLREQSRCANREIRMRRKDGSQGDLLISVERIELDGQVCTLGMARDLTESNRVGAALLESKQRYRSLFENMLHGYAYCRILCEDGKPVDFHYLDVNPTFERLTELKNVTGRKVSEVIPGIQRTNPELFEVYGRVAMTGHHEQLETYVPAMDIWFSIAVYCPEPEHFVAVFDNITERKRLEEQLRQAQKMEAIGQLAGGVAHDFNNILAAMMMQFGLMRAHPQLDPEMTESLEELETHAQRAANLTRQLLMFSRRSLVRLLPLDLNDVIEHLLRMLRRLLGENIRIEFQCRSGMPLVEADAGMIDQLVMNLSVNARDAMPAGGRLTLATTEVEFTEAQTALNPARRAGQFVVISVADTGSGMDEATLRRIFEPFFTTKEPGKGTGLGLATVYGIAKQHHGWVEVESTVAQGSTFRVFLPALPKTQALAATVAATPPTPRGYETILVVEDEWPLRRMMTQSLKSLGYQVLSAGNGTEAISCWSKHGGAISLLLTDMVMPEGLNGLELSEKFRQERPALKVIITSGYSAEISARGWPEGTGIVYLPKPFNDQTLGRAVRECLDQRQKELLT